MSGTSIHQKEAASYSCFSQFTSPHLQPYDAFHISALSSMTFFQQLERRIAAVDSLLCVGLDPHVTHLSSPTAEAAKQFCLDIIHHTHPYAACFKPNSAFFEAFGPEGMSALVEVLQAIPSDIPVILDVKRGDIDTTAQAYAEAALGVLKVGCVTLSPYMGTDSIRPFVTGKFADRAAFILCKTSNPSSKVGF